MVIGKNGAVGVLLHFHQPPLKIEGNWMNNIRKMWCHPVADADKWNIACYIGSYRALPHCVNQLRAAGLEPYVMGDYSGVLLHGLSEAEGMGLFAEMAAEKGGSEAAPVISELRAAVTNHPSSIDLLATGFYHPLFHPAATPKADWPLHVDEYFRLHGAVMGEGSTSLLRGFWPPEMAIPGDPADIYDLIDVLWKRGIRWIAVPTVPYKDRENETALRAPPGKRMGSYERYYAPHVLVGRKDGRENRIVALIRDPRSEPNKGVDFAACARQVAGEYRKEMRAAGKDPWFPPLVLVAGDGENGNDMMQGNFFRNRFNPYVGSRPETTDCPLVTGTAYLESILAHAFGSPVWERAGEVFSEIQIQPEGYSWSGVLGNIWLSHSRKLDLYKAIFALSEQFHKIDRARIEPAIYDRILHAILRTQTSCYTWWDSEFWLGQGWGAIEDARMELHALT